MAGKLHSVAAVSRKTLLQLAWHCNNSYIYLCPF